MSCQIETPSSVTAMCRLAEFIKQTRTTEMTHTHVLLGAPFGKLNVSNSRMREFWSIYSACADMLNPIYLAEKPLTELPVLVDIDLKTRLIGEIPNRIYSDDQVEQVVKAYQETLKNVLIDVQQDALTCVLLEKEPYVIELNGIRYVKNGFHLHFPKLFIDNNVQEAYLVPIVQKKLQGLFDNLYTLDDGSNDQKPEKIVHYDFIDAASITVHWLMYGSKKPNNSPYSATKCFADEVKRVDFEMALGDYILPVLTGEVKSAQCSGRVMRMLPRILSTRLHGRTSYYYRAKPSVITPVFDQFARVKTARPIYDQRTVTETLQEIELLMPLIGDWRADTRSDWLSIGFCIWNITQGDEDGLSVWLEFSDRSEKFNEAECICLWKNMRESNYTLATLKYFAKLDSPAAYERICKAHGDKLINCAVEGGHNDMAKLLKNEYGQDFVYSSNTETWYRFSKHIWKQSKHKCFDLSERISDGNGAILTHFTKHITAAKSELKRMAPKTRNSDSDEEERRAELVLKIKTLEKLKKSCKINGFKKAVMQECQEVFRSDEFASNLNTNPDIIAFKNGVYDFKNDCFRAGKPEDYLSESLPIEYKDYGSIDNPAVMEVSSFFRMVLPDDLVREYFFDQVCQLFVGGNPDKVFLIWTGTGDNGKTVTQRLFEKMLGPLAVKMSTSLITGSKTKMGQAAPELARTGNGVRWVVMDEPNQDEQITTGMLKAITGNDSYWARDLYQGGSETREIIPLYQTHMLCNGLPAVKKSDTKKPDDAFWDRLRVVEFEAKFLSEEKCPMTYEEQTLKKIFPKDKKFASKMDALLQPLAWFLIAHWRGLNKSERIVPEKVKIATCEYREENSDDPFTEFVDEFIVAGDGAVCCDELYVKFQAWYIRYDPRRKAFGKKATVSAFTKILGALDKKLWKGYRWADDEQEATRSRLAVPQC